MQYFIIFCKNVAFYIDIAILSHFCYTKDMSDDKFIQILKDSGVSVTKVRQAIFTALTKADKPLKNGQIAALVPMVDRASVYRTLELFSRLGITTTIVRGWIPYTELAEPFKPHHHHIICEQCGRVVEIENNTLEDVLNIVAGRYDFSLKNHVVELTGLCRDCQQKQAD